MQQYRTSTKREEIIRIVQKKFEAGSTVTIWQKTPGTEERSFKCEAKFTSIDIYEGIFTVNIDPNQAKCFNRDLETYFLFEDQGFVFKTKTSLYVSTKDSSRAFTFPQSVKLKELRIHPRTYFAIEDKRVVCVKFENKNKNGPIHIDVSCPIYNISKGGICIIVTKETLSNVELSGAIELEGLSFFESLANELKAVVKNARVHSKKGITTDDSYALGLEFEA